MLRRTAGEAPGQNVRLRQMLRQALCWGGRESASSTCVSSIRPSPPYSCLIRDLAPESAPPRGRSVFATSLDEALQDCLIRAGIDSHRLTDPVRVNTEAAWRRVYGRAFRGQPRLRHGARAEHEYGCQACHHFLIVPFSAGVAGLPINVHRRTIAAYECRGPLVALCFLRR